MKLDWLKPLLGRTGPFTTVYIDATRSDPNGETEVVDRWKELNRKVVERAWVVPFGHRKLSTFLSERMDFENCAKIHPLYKLDYSSLCLK